MNDLDADDPHERGGSAIAGERADGPANRDACGQPHTISLSPLSGRTLITVRAGRALTVIISPGLKGLAFWAALVAGLWMALIFIMPGTTKTLGLSGEGFARSTLMTLPSASKTPATCFLLRPSTCSARIEKSSLFLRGLALATSFVGLETYAAFAALGAALGADLAALPFFFAIVHAP